MKNLAPLLLIGGVAVLAMGGKKKKKNPPIYKGFVAGHNQLMTGTLKGLFEAANLKAGYDMFDVDFHADPAGLATQFHPDWTHADAIIAVVDTANDNRLAGAWVTPAEAAGPKAKGMTPEELGTTGMQEASALMRSGLKA